QRRRRRHRVRRRAERGRRARRRRRGRHRGEREQDGRRARAAGRRRRAAGTRRGRRCSGDVGGAHYAATVTSRLFTSESVTEGHPDKICDQISDSILDRMLEDDRHARVAVETMVTTGLVHVAGEVTTAGYVEIPRIVRDVVTGIGYTSSRVGFDGDSCGVAISIGQQSSDIAAGVDKSLESRDDSTAGDPLDLQGAGDQGLMFGYATDETPQLMPLPILLAHRLSARLTEVRKQGIVRHLRPDGKTQVTIAYEGDRPVGVHTVVMSAQHDEEVDVARVLAP